MTPSTAPVLLQDLTVVMLAAGAATLLFHKLKQPVVLGYILAGLLISPYATWLPAPLHARVSVHDAETVHLLAQLGVIFLLFHLGLHFSVRGFAKVGLPAMLAATLQTGLMTLAGYATGRWMGWAATESLFLGAILSISSSVVITKTLAETGRDKEPFAKLIVGILIGQDILAIGLMAALSTIALTGSAQVGVITGQMLGLGALLMLVLTAGLLFLPWLLNRVDRHGHHEILLIAVLGVIFSAAMLTDQLKAGVAMGAFLAGAIMAETPQKTKIEHLFNPLKDMFGAIFFVATGMLLDPKDLPALASAIGVLFFAAVVFKVITAAFGALVAGNSLKTAMRVGTGLVPIGEFSFVIAALGGELAVTRGDLYPTTVAVAVLTTVCGPWLLRAADPMALFIHRHAPAPLAMAGRAYHHWFNLPRTDGPVERVRALLRKMALQVFLNMVLVTGLFGAATGAAPWVENNLPARGAPAWLAWPRSGLLVAAAALSAPILVAAARKSRAAAMLFADFTVSRQRGAHHTPVLRAVLTHLVFGGVLLLLGVWVLLLTAFLLPYWPVVLCIFALLGVLAALLWQRMIRLYAGAQGAIRETLADKQENRGSQAG